MRCLSTEEFVRLAEGPRSHGYASHFDECAECRSMAVRVVADRSTLNLDDAARGQLGEMLQGEVFADRFRIVRKVGSGGMGMVFEAEDLRLHVPVAVKLLYASTSDSSKGADRITKEALLGRRVSHPRVCRVFDVFEHEGLPFITMQYLQGETLSNRLDRPVAFAEACHVLRGVMDGLEAIHAAGVVHRDLKPGNIMMVDQEPVLLDFGLAGDFNKGTMTVGIRMGSPAYCAPEQARGEAVTVAADVYALGVVAREVFANVFRSEVTQKKFSSERKRILDWIARCTQFDPTRRYASVVQAHSAFENAVRSASTFTRVAPWALLAASAVITWVVTTEVRGDIVRPPSVSTPRSIVRAAPTVDRPLFSTALVYEAGPPMDAQTNSTVREPTLSAIQPTSMASRRRSRARVSVVGKRTPEADEPVQSSRERIPIFK